MKIICNKCGHVIDRDKMIKGQVVEEYRNIYGTYCPICGELNKSFNKLNITKDVKNKMEFLKKKMRDKIRKKLRR